jgi:DNA-binding NarL/FixJ family response regulator
VITTVAIFTRLRLFQELLSAFVGARPGLAVIAVSASEMEATRVVISQRPDVVLVDAALPGVWNVIDAATQAGVRTIVFGLADNPHPIQSASRHGCRDVLLTSARAQDVLDALEHARRPDPQPAERPVATGVAALTARELDVLRLIAQGLSNKEIAAVLTVSVPTVKTHVHNLLHKLCARRRADAARLLHVAASAAVVEARAVRHLGVVGRGPGPAGAGPGRMRSRSRLHRISTQSPSAEGESATRAVRQYGGGAHCAAMG